MDVSNNLKEYIHNNIIPKYDNNFIGDGRQRIQYVIDRSEELIKQNNLSINSNILYTAICYHDIRFDNEEVNHEVKSANYMYEDAFLKEFFSDNELIMIKEAIEDQRANNNGEPRNIYGKILSSASRNCSIEQCFARSY